MQILSAGTQKTMSDHFASQTNTEFLRYRPDFLHVIINFIGFQITFSNMNMGSYNTPPFISEFVSNRPFTHAESETLTLQGLTITRVFSCDKQLKK